MKKPVTIIKPPTLNNSFEEDRLSDRLSDRMENTTLQLTQQSLDRLRSLTFKKIVKNLSLCGDEQLTNNTFDDHMSCHTSKEEILLNPSIIHLFKNERDFRDFLQDQKVKYEQAMLKKQERQAKIIRYKTKRRIWKHSISYGCRKLVADSRLRIKGRFISKQDTATIEALVNNKQQPIDDLFDAKRNLDIEKFHGHTQIFRGVPDPKTIPKRQILSAIRDEALFKNEQEQITNRITQRKPIWNLIHRRTK